MFPNEVLLRAWFRQYQAEVERRLRTQIGEYGWPRLRALALAGATPKENRMSADRKPWLAFAALSLIWGSSFLWIKVAVQEVGPMTLVAFRLLFGLLALLIAARVTRQRLQISRGDLPAYAVVAALNTAIPFTLISWGETRIDSGTAAILNGAMPLFVLVLAHFWLQDEHITWMRLAGLLLGFGGVGLVVGLGAGGFFEGNRLGQLAVLGGALSYALANTFSRRYLRNRQPLTQATMVVLIAEAMLWVSTLTFERPLRLPALPISWVAILWLGLLGTGTAYLLYFYLINAWGSTRSSLITYAMPVIGVALGVSFLGESLDPRVLLGTLLVVAGVVLVNRKSVARRMIPREAQGELPAQVGLPAHAGLPGQAERLTFRDASLELAVPEETHSSRTAA
jgi:drug/metabolite transporter (DMT)-like permease